MSGDYIEQILTRIQTYKISKWHYSNSHKLTPYQLASIGYVATALMNVQCCICHHQVSLNDKQSEQEILSNLQNHQQQCLYKGEHIRKIDKQDFYLKMDDIFVSIPLISKSTPGNQNIQLPVLDMISFYEQIGPHKHTLAKIFKKFLINDEKINIPFLLQFMGWRFPASSNTKLQCCFCARQILLKDYASTKEEQQPAQLPQGKKLNLFKEHRFYCLWVQGLEGWKIYMQHIWDKLNEKQSLFKNMRPQQVVKIRVQMDKYLQSFQTKTHEVFQKIQKIMQQCNEMAKITEQPEDIELSTAKIKRNMIQFNELITEHLRKPLKKIKIN